MDKNKFSEEDHKKFVDFLNMVAEKAKFEFNTDDSLKYVRLLSHMQQQILPKMKANILEIKRVVETQPEEAPKEAPKKKTSKARK
jgi:hypothetical protein